ncbi:MAG: hypothetical protein JJ863_36970 [Deltaproteobacteria bacterium]|nr:hypothetical protein [Deltaproteobacteria bacterium]
MKLSIGLLLSLALAACGSSEEEPPSAAEGEPTAGAETTEQAPADTAPERTCAQTAEAFTEALIAVFEGYTPPADEAALQEPLEWSQLEAWNDLQSADYRAAEGDDLGRLSFRYHAWGVAMSQTNLPTLFREGPLELEEGDDGLALTVADGSLTIRLAREDGCLLVDEN